MTSFFSVYTLLIGLGCLLVGVAYSWLMYRSSKHLAPKLRYSLALMRSVVVALLVFLMFAPLVKIIRYQYEKPIVIIAQDNSLSIKAFASKYFSLSNYLKDLNALKNRLSEKYEVFTYLFGDSVQSGLAFDGADKTSNASRLISQINDAFGNRNLGAIVLASDGIFNRGGNPSYELAKLPTTLYTLALGDTIARRDLAIAQVNYNNMVFLDNEFVVEVQVQATASKGEKTQLVIQEGTQVLASKSIEIHQDNFVHDVQLRLKANKKGIHRYTVKLSPLNRELTEKNNRQEIFVEVIDDRKNILIAAAAPHPDLALIKQALSAKKNYQIKLLFDKDLDTAKLSNYDMLILHQLPSSSQKMAKLSSYTGAIWYIFGAQSNLSALNQVQQQLGFAGANFNMQEVFPVANADFSLFSLSAEAISQLKTYPPLLVPDNAMRLKGLFSTAIKQRIGRVNTESPLLFFSQEQNPKTAYLLGEGLWRWRMEEAKNPKNQPFTAELIQKTVQYLSLADDKRRLKVYLTKNNFEENENITLNGTLYNDAFEAVNEPDLQLQLVDEQAKEYRYTFAKTEKAYQLDLGTLPSGQYHYLAKAVLGGKTFTAKGAFYVNELIAEYQQSQANHALLYSMASQQGGKMYFPKEINQLADEILDNEKIKTIGYEDLRYEELIQLKWIFVVILALLSLEWFLRKRFGER